MKIKIILAVICLLTIISLCFISCTTQYNAIKVVANEGKNIARIDIYVRTAMPLPGHPPPTTAQKDRLTVNIDNKQVYDSSWVELGLYQDSDAFDLVWSPNMKILASRRLNILTFINKDRIMRTLNTQHGNSLLSSYKWLDNDNLILVTKKLDSPLNMYGYPVHYHSFIDNATQISIYTYNLSKHKLKLRYKQDLKEVTFLFNSIHFFCDEISPFSAKVIFNDGKNIKVYDDKLHKIIAQTKATGSLEGIWWIDKDKVLLGFGLLSGEKRFSLFDAKIGKIKDVSKEYLAKWQGSYSTKEWFK